MGTRARCEICKEHKWQVIAAGRKLCFDCNAKRKDDRQHHKRGGRHKRESVKVELPW